MQHSAAADGFDSGCRGQRGERVRQCGERLIHLARGVVARERKRTALLATASSWCMASSTWEAWLPPAAQAAPLAAAMPARSRRCTMASPSWPGKPMLLVPARRSAPPPLICAAGYSARTPASKRSRRAATAADELSRDSAASRQASPRPTIAGTLRCRRAGRAPGCRRTAAAGSGHCGCRARRCPWARAACARKATAGRWVRGKDRAAVCPRSGRRRRATAPRARGSARRSPRPETARRSRCSPPSATPAPYRAAAPLPGNARAAAPRGPPADR